MQQRTATLHRSVGVTLGLAVLVLSTAQVLSLEEKASIPQPASSYSSGKPSQTMVLPSSETSPTEAGGESTSQDGGLGEAVVADDTEGGDASGSTETAEPLSSDDDDGANPHRQEKRFLRGLTDKRFLKGLTDSDLDKRFLRGLTDKRFLRGLTADKRFLRGLTADKRFMRGFAKRTSPSLAEDMTDAPWEDGQAADKRFIVGLQEGKRFIKGLTGGAAEKRFLRGYTSRADPMMDKWEDNDDGGDDIFYGLEERSMGEPGMEDIVYAAEDEDSFDKDKRFIRGLAPGKRFIQGLVPNSKRFMKGFAADKKFIHGLTADKRFMRGLVSDKRFMIGLVPNDKRFIQGLVPSKRFIQGLTADKKFMRGLVSNKRFINGLLPADKRFMRGLVKRSADAVQRQGSEKRFMHGLVRKSSHDAAGADSLTDLSNVSLEKKFMRGMTRKSTDGVHDKRFMHGLVRKAEANENGFLRFDDGLNAVGGEGFKKRAHFQDSDSFSERPQEQITDQKRFMHGLVKKEKEYADKRFMKGFRKREFDGSSDDESNFSENRLDGTDGEFGVQNDKRFMYGFTKKERYQDTEPEMDKKFMRGFTKKEFEQGDSDVNLDKKFMRGFTKKEFERGNDLELDKKIMRSFTKKESERGNNLALDKKFMRGFAKKESEIDGELELDKKFMRGFAKKDSKQSAEIKEDKKFMRGFAKKESETEPNMAINKKFMRGFSKKAAGNDFEVEMNKKFMRGFTKKDTNNEIEPELNKKFMKGFGKKNKFIDGGWWSLAGRAENEKRFMHGLTKRAAHGSKSFTDNARHSRLRTKRSVDFGVGDGYFGNGYQTAWYDNPHTSFATTSSSSSSPDKRFIRGMVRRSSPDYNDGRDSSMGKRFMRGLVRRGDDYFDSNNDDVDNGLEKRFIVGLVPNKRFIVGLSEYYAKRFNSAGTGHSTGNGYGSSGYSKRFMRGLSGYKRASPSSSLPWEESAGQNGLSEHVFTDDLLRSTSPNKRFIMGLIKPNSSSGPYNPYSNKYVNSGDSINAGDYGPYSST